MCNRKESFQTCFTCSSEKDSNCATLKSTLPEKTCNDYMDTCKVYVKPNQTTLRGCFKDDQVECSPQSTNCRSCAENNCNGEVFPSTRLACYHCDAENKESDCFNSIDDKSELFYPCETFYFRDSCYLYITNQSVVHRGCTSDPTPYPGMCLNDPKRCQTVIYKNINRVCH